MGFLNKLYENVRVNSTVVDHVNSNEIYNTTSQTIGSGNEAVSAANVALSDVTGDGLPAHAIEHGKAWADDGKLYSTVQAAENAATDIMFIGPGTFAEAVTIDTANLTVIGSGRATLIDGGTTATAIQIDGVSSTIKNLAVKTTAGGGNPYYGIRDTNSAGPNEISGIWVEESDSHGISIVGTSADGNRIVNVWCDSANIDGDDINMGADNSVVDDIIGTVNDLGTGNSVGETA